MRTPSIVIALLTTAVASACSPTEEHVGVPDPAPTSTRLQTVECEALRQVVVRSIADALVHARYGGVEIDDKIGGKSDDGETDESAERELESEPPPIEVEDLLKVAGDHVYVLSDTTLSIVRIDADGAPQLDGALELPGASRSIGLFVHDDVVFALQSVSPDDEAPFAGTRVTAIDVGDVAEPTIRRRFDIEGDFEMARRVGDDVHLVTTSRWRVDRSIWEIAYADQPNLPEREPNADDERQEQLRDAARAEVEQILAAELPDIDELMPRLVVDDDERALHSCEDVLFNGRPSVHVTSLTKLDTDLEIGGQGIMASEFGGTVHGEHFYAAFANRWGRDAGTSHLHAFDLSYNYLATTDLAGVVVDEHSVGATDTGVHIVATEREGAKLNTAEFDGQEFNEISATLLTDDELVVANRVTSNAAYVATAKGGDERIFALGFDAAAATGPFEIGGVPSMIHAVEEDRILVVAQQNNDDGEQIGVQIELFDGAAKPLSSASVPTGEFAAWSEAMWEPRSLAYSNGLVAFPVNIEAWDEAEGANFSGVLLYETGNEIVRRGAVDHTDLRAVRWCRQNDQADDCEAPMSSPWWTHVRRSAFVGDRLVTVSDAGFKVHDVETLDEQGSLVFD